MKKNFFHVGVMALALLFVFAACSDEDIVIHGTSIGGPSNLRAVAHDGVNLITWDAVTNASGYSVFRKDTVTNHTVRLTDNTTALYHRDVVSWDNQLVDGRRYTYTVITRNQNSVRSVEAPVFDGSRSVNVNAKIPATLEITMDAPVITIANGFAYVKVANQPNLNFKFEFEPVTDDPSGYFNININENWGSNHGADWFNPLRVFEFPAIKGDITVTASFPNSFYTAEAEATVEITSDSFLEMGEDTPDRVASTFAATRADNGSFVRLTWGNVRNATGYKIFKAPFISASSTDIVWENPSQNGGTVNISGPWVPVTVTQERISLTEWIAVDTVAFTEKFIYVIFAENANGLSEPRFASNVVNTVEEGLSLNLTTSVRSGTDGLGINVSWDATAGATYTLAFAEITTTASTPGDVPQGNVTISTNYQIVGAWTPITIPATAIVAGNAFVPHTFTAAQSGKNYIFRVIETRNGQAMVPNYTVLSTNAFSVVATFSIETTDEPRFTTNAAANSLTIEVTRDEAFPGRDYTLSLFRIVTTPGFEKREAVTIPAADAVFAKDAEKWFFTDTVPDISLQYDYLITAANFVGNSTSELGNLRAHGFGRTISSIAERNNTDAVMDLGPGSPAANLPVRGAVVGTGRVINYTDDNEPFNDGPNINGLRVRVEYHNNATDPLATTETTLTISRVSRAVPALELGSNERNRTDHWYFITLPANVQPGAITVVGYEWDGFAVISPGTVIGTW